MAEQRSFIQLISFICFIVIIIACFERSSAATLPLNAASKLHRYEVGVANPDFQFPDQFAEAQPSPSRIQIDNIERMRANGSSVLRQPSDGLNDQQTAATVRSESTVTVNLTPISSGAKKSTPKPPVPSSIDQTETKIAKNAADGGRPTVLEQKFERNQTTGEYSLK